MAALQPASPRRLPLAQAASGSQLRGNTLTAVLLGCLFGLSVFAANTFALDLIGAGWQRIQLIQGTFQPTKDAQRLYASPATDQAVDSRGSGLPKLAPGAKLPPIDQRITAQALQEHQLKAPTTFGR